MATVKIEKIYPLYNDLMFKHIFGTSKNIRFTKYLLDKLELCDKAMIDDIKIVNSAKLITEQYNDKKFEVDVLIRMPNNDIINLEMYNNPSRSSAIKSEMYACRLFAKQLRSGNDYEKISKVIQYNFIRNGTLKRDKKITLFGMRDINGKTYTTDDYIQIYDVNIDKKKELENDMSKETKTILDFMNASSIEEMKELAKKDEVIKDMFKEMTIYSEGDDFITPCYDRDGYLLSVGRDHGKEEGRKEGIAIGEKRGFTLAIQKMLENNISFEEVAKYMNISIDEIKKMINTK